MSHGIFYVSLKVILKNSQGQILGLEAAKVGDLAGFYDLPGGRIDNNEVGTDFLPLIDREIKEEVGNIQYKLNPKPIFTLTWKLSSYEYPFLYVYFEAEYTSGDIAISDEHIGLKWIDLKPEEVTKHFTGWHLKTLKELYEV